MTEIAVSVLLGSRTDWETMKEAAQVLKRLGVPFEVRVLSAHRTPEALVEYVKEAEKRGVRVFIAGAGGAAHLAGVIAAHTLLPVIGVPMPTSLAGGLDSVLSMLPMPAGVPVAVVSVGKAGATNGGLLAAQILALSDPDLRERLRHLREERARAILGEPALSVD